MKPFEIIRYSIQNGHTYNFATNHLSAVQNISLLLQKPHRLVVVCLGIDGYATRRDFTSFEEAIEFKTNKELVFRFIEYNENDKKKFKSIVIDEVEKRILLYSNLYEVSEGWNIFLNSEKDITAQRSGTQGGENTIRFNHIPEDIDYYIYISCLIFTIRNTELTEPKEVKTQINEIAKRLTFAFPVLQS